MIGDRDHDVEGARTQRHRLHRGQWGFGSVDELPVRAPSRSSTRPAKLSLLVAAHVPFLTAMSTDRRSSPTADPSRSRRRSVDVGAGPLHAQRCCASPKAQTATADRGPHRRSRSRCSSAPAGACSCTSCSRSCCPPIGIARGVGPIIGLVIGMLAIVSITYSIRRFWRAEPLEALALHDLRAHHHRLPDLPRFQGHRHHHLSATRAVRSLGCNRCREMVHDVHRADARTSHRTRHGGNSGSHRHGQRHTADTRRGAAHSARAVHP